MLMNELQFTRHVEVKCIKALIQRIGQGSQCILLSVLYYVWSGIIWE